MHNVTKFSTEQKRDDSYCHTYIQHGTVMHSAEVKCVILRGLQAKVFGVASDPNRT